MQIYIKHFLSYPGLEFTHFSIKYKDRIFGEKFISGFIMFVWVCGGLGSCEHYAWIYVFFVVVLVLAFLFRFKRNL